MSDLDTHSAYGGEHTAIDYDITCGLQCGLVQVLLIASSPIRRWVYLNFFTVSHQDFKSSTSRFGLIVIVCMLFFLLFTGFKNNLWTHTTFFQCWYIMKS
ncbi:hypothetical protein GDO81_026461 [Engystomops pustulosus]|uniref:Uncharacterized protein n=1 Tax=Engystomops pustulosus TaxID=76066 RepID=A0AAV6YQT6_ENGPU|nr:hypothetical protein GDO81_026461 [Engystomops pustulosus]